MIRTSTLTFTAVHEYTMPSDYSEPHYSTVNFRTGLEHVVTTFVEGEPGAVALAFLLARRMQDKLDEQRRARAHAYR